MFSAYCINLAARADRWTYMQRLAVSAGFTLERVDALNAADPEAAQELEGMTASGPTGIVGKGALACTQSHMRAWRAFLATDAPAAVFLEDDIIVSDDFAAVAAEALRRHDRFDLIKLECGGSAPDGLVLGPDAALCAGRALRPCYQIATDAAAYILSRKGAEIALQRASRIDVGVDHFLFYPIRRRGSLGLPFAIIAPAIAIQDRTIGSNISRHRYRDGKFRRMLRRTLYEAAPAPFMLWKLARGARIAKVPFTATLPADPPHP